MIIINLGDSSPKPEPEDSTQVQAEAQLDETMHVAAVTEMTEHVEDACYVVSEDVCHEIDSQGDQHEVEMESDDSSPDPPGVSTLNWHFALIAMDSEVIDTAYRSPSPATSPSTRSPRCTAR